MSSVTSFPLEAGEGERWLEYEAQLTELAERQGCLFLCHYARRALDPKHLLERVRSHSSIIHAGEIAPNLYYIPSRDAVDTAPDSLGLNELLADVADRARIQRMRRQGGEETLTRERPLEVALASCAVPFAILAAKRNARGIIIDFTWQYVNPAAARAIGKSADELIGRAVLELLPSVWTSPGLFESFVRVVETGQQASCEASSTGEGGLRWWQNLLSKIDEGVAVWFSDITERKHSEEQHRRSQAYLADGERLSHTGSWAWNVTSQELSFWSLGHLRIVGLEPNSPPSYALFRPLVHPDDLPSIEERFASAVRDRVVRGDRVQLQQVLLNLIMNAIDAMSTREQGLRELLIQTFQDSPYRVHIEVRDSGIGVSEETLRQMFEPFYTTKAQGTGIGLSISRSIIEAHNGRLWAERRGTAPGLSLHIVLPRASSTAESDTQ